MSRYKGNKRQKVNKTMLKCLICGNNYIHYRVIGKQRAKGHIKGIYCFKCKKKTKHRTIF